jgi:hypothetical protein
VKDREIKAIRRQLNYSDATPREAHSRFQVQMEVQRQLMLPPSTIPVYSSSSMHNQLAFPPLTPASGMAPRTMYAGSEDRHPRQRSGSKDRHHRDRGSSDDRHQRQDSGSGDRYHREYDNSDYRHRHESGSMSSSLCSSQPAWQSRPGQNYPAFPGSRVFPARQLNAQMTAYQRMLKFGSADPPKLTKNTLESVYIR